MKSGVIPAAFLLASLPLVALAGEERVVVEPGVCDYLTAYEPAPDVAYQPGVDAYGNSLAPADLDDSGRIALPEEFTIDLFVRLKDAIDIPPGSNLAPVEDSEIAVGTVSVRGNEVYFNDRPLASEEQNAIAAECRRRQDEAVSKRP